MRNLSAVLFLAFAACGGGGSDTPPDTALPPDSPPPDTGPPPPDAQQLDLTCAANPAPTTAPQSVTASGSAVSLDVAFDGTNISPDIQALDEADVDVCTADCQGNDLLASTTTATLPCDATGCSFTVASDTTGTPLNAYLKVSKGDEVITSNIFPSEPIAADVMNVPGIALKPNALTLLGFIGQTQNKGNGMLVVRVSDCALTGAQGATLSVNPAGDTPLDLGGFDENLAGTFLILNVPPGTVTVGATVNGTAFRAHDVVSFADELTATQVLPGFLPAPP